MSPSFYDTPDTHPQQCCVRMTNFLDDGYRGVQILHHTASDSDSMYLDAPKASDAEWWLVYDGGYSSWPISYCPFCGVAITEKK